MVGLGDSSLDIVPVIPAPQHFLHSLILKVVFIMCSAIFVCQDVRQFDCCSFARNPNIRKIYGGGDCLKSQIFLSENRKSASGLVYGYRVFQSREAFSDSLGAGENVYLTPLFGFINFGESAWMFSLLWCEVAGRQGFLSCLSSH